MTDDRLPLAELMAKTGDGDFLRTIAENVLQIIMEADVEGLVGAGRHARSGDRTTGRNGYRDRSLDTRLGTLNLKIPKLRTYLSMREGSSRGPSCWAAATISLSSISPRIRADRLQERPTASMAGTGSTRCATA